MAIEDKTMQDRYLTWKEVKPITGNKAYSTIWRWYKAGLFPKPRKIGPNSIAWLESEIKAWQEQCPETGG